MNTMWLLFFALLIGSSIHSALTQENEKEKAFPSEPKERFIPLVPMTSDHLKQRSGKELRSMVDVPCVKSYTTVPLMAGEAACLTSPNYPKKYPKGVDCGWNVTALDPDVSLNVVCQKVKIQKPKKGKCKDVLLINDDKYCGKVRGLMSNATDSMFIKFRSNRRVQSRGFKCFVTAVANLPDAYTCTNCGTPNRGRIAGGEATEPNEYPWQVAIANIGTDDSMDFFCGGSIINDRWVLSAAHCQITTLHEVIVGAHEWANPSPSKDRVSISAVYNHEDYDSSTYDNDICLVLLSEFLDFSDAAIGPVCLPPYGIMETYEDSVAIVTGWGKLVFGGSSFPEQLQEVEVDVVSNTVCRDDYSVTAITDNMLCAGLDQGGKDSCQGDSGGPLVNETDGISTIIGVVSWGEGCAWPTHYGVYARVTMYLDWIMDTIGAGMGSYCIAGE